MESPRRPRDDDEEQQQQQQQHHSPRGGSLLESLGSELLSILTPVSACMFLVVILVRTLTSTSNNNNNGISTPSSIATIAYAENPSDSTAHKLEGALLNAAIFVAVVTLVTFFLVALFYFRCNKCLRIYVSFSVFSVLAYFGSLVALLFVQTFTIPIDVITFALIFFNFAVVGVLVVFPVVPVPIIFTQGYLVLIGMLVAFWFTYLPEWTTWCLLMALAAYDVAAVLLPGGPLNLLLELSMKREEELPALVYESRPSVPQVRPPPVQQQQMRRWRRRAPPASSSSASSPPSSSTAAASSSPSPNSLFSKLFGRGTYQALNSANLEAPESVEQQNSSTVAEAPGAEEAPAVNRTPEDESSPLITQPVSTAIIGNEERLAAAAVPELNEDSPGHDDEGGRIESTTEGGIKLGLGDFIFYSLLVGRAAIYDLMTAWSCYLAIVAGLGVTLVLLAVWRRALPALPVSISLGVLFYFLTRLILEPLVFQLDMHLVFF